MQIKSIWTLALSILGFYFVDGEAPVEDLNSDFSNADELQFSEYSKLILEDDGADDEVVQLQIYFKTEFRSATSDPRRLWDDGIIPYKLSEKFNSKQKAMIKEAIADFREKTCISFIPHTNETQFLILRTGKGCGSVLGKVPGGSSQSVSLANGCFSKGILLHELMHALGFIHEHNRPDRDDFVKIIYANIKDGKKSQFTKRSSDDVQTFNTIYDYDSVMHYGANVFAKNRSEPTIIPLKKGKKIGQRRGFSDIDILKINKLYNCEVNGNGVSLRQDEDDDDEDMEPLVEHQVSNVNQRQNFDFEDLGPMVIHELPARIQGVNSIPSQDYDDEDLSPIVIHQTKNFKPFLGLWKQVSIPKSEFNEFFLPSLNKTMVSEASPNILSTPEIFKDASEKSNRSNQFNHRLLTATKLSETPDNTKKVTTPTISIEVIKKDPIDHFIFPEENAQEMTIKNGASHIEDDVIKNKIFPLNSFIPIHLPMDIKALNQIVTKNIHPEILTNEITKPEKIFNEESETFALQNTRTIDVSPMTNAFTVNEENTIHSLLPELNNIFEIMFDGIHEEAVSDVTTEKTKSLPANDARVDSADHVQVITAAGAIASTSGGNSATGIDGSMEILNGGRLVITTGMTMADPTDDRIPISENEKKEITRQPTVSTVINEEIEILTTESLNVLNDDYVAIDNNGAREAIIEEILAIPIVMHMEIPESETTEILPDWNMLPSMGEKTLVSETTITLPAEGIIDIPIDRTPMLKDGLIEVPVDKTTLILLDDKMEITTKESFAIPNNSIAISGRNAFPIDGAIKNQLDEDIENPIGGSFVIPIDVPMAIPDNENKEILINDTAVPSVDVEMLISRDMAIAVTTDRSKADPASGGLQISTDVVIPVPEDESVEILTDRIKLISLDEKLEITTNGPVTIIANSDIIAIPTEETTEISVSGRMTLPIEGLKDGSLVIPIHDGFEIPKNEIQGSFADRSELLSVDEKMILLNDADTAVHTDKIMDIPSDGILPIRGDEVTEILSEKSILTSLDEKTKITTDEFSTSPNIDSVAISTVGSIESSINGRMAVPKDGSILTFTEETILTSMNEEKTETITISTDRTKVVQTQKSIAISSGILNDGKSTILADENIMIESDKIIMVPTDKTEAETEKNHTLVFSDETMKFPTDATKTLQFDENKVIPVDGREASVKERTTSMSADGDGVININGATTMATDRIWKNSTAILEDETITIPKDRAVKVIADKTTEIPKSRIISEIMSAIADVIKENKVTEKILEQDITGNMTEVMPPEGISVDANAPNIVSSKNTATQAIMAKVTFGSNNLENKATTHDLNKIIERDEISIDKRATLASSKTDFPANSHEALHISSFSSNEKTTEAMLLHDIDIEKLEEKEVMLPANSHLSQFVREIDINDESVTVKDINLDISHIIDKHAERFHRLSIIQVFELRTAVSDPRKIWNKGIIPFVLSDKYGTEQKEYILVAMKEFDERTCVKFIPRKIENSYLLIEPEDRCVATIVFKIGKLNKMPLNEDCYTKGIILHELMLLLGFVHEQNRPDRDQYVIIVWDNIIPGLRQNFWKYSWSEVLSFNLSYDYDSIMHYGAYEFAIDEKKPAIIALKPGVKLGQRDGFSKKDVIKINKLYHCENLTSQPEVPKTGSLSTIIENFKKTFMNLLSVFLKKIRQTFRSLRSL